MSGNDQLIVDLEALKRLGGELIGSANALSGLQDMTAQLAHEVGHPGLASKVGEFSTSWGHKREELIDNVTALGQQVYGVVEELQKTDTTLATALTDGGSTA